MSRQTKKITSSQTKKTISLLLAGKGKAAKKFAGKHVFVIKDKVVLLKKGEAAWRDFLMLEKKYNEAPILTFVPRPGISYILIYVNC